MRKPAGSFRSTSSDLRWHPSPSRRAQLDLAELITTRNLPASTRDRVRASIEPLAAFPRIGKRLTGRWRGFRVVLGPWPWMLVVYVYEEATNAMTVVAIHDARTISSATTEA